MFPAVITQSEDKMEVLDISQWVTNMQSNKGLNHYEHTEQILHKVKPLGFQANKHGASVLELFLVYKRKKLSTENLSEIIQGRLSAR